jgi:hypothetical protein
MVNQNREKLLTQFRLFLDTPIEPFLGDDESLKRRYGKNWERKKAEYIELCEEKLRKLREKYLPFYQT